MTATSAHILIVDDAREIRQPLAQYLQKNGQRTSMAADATEARRRIEVASIDLVVLDIMLPGEDGLSLCRWLVSNTEIPVILLTAMASDTDRIVGLELGAEDYVVKPFNPRELLARIRVALRRRPPQPDTTSSKVRWFNGWRHDPNMSEIRHQGGQSIELTTLENRLLTFFLDNPNTVLSRAVLLDHVVGREEKAYDRAIDNQVGRLRKKIEKSPSQPVLLKTVWGGGYKFVAEVTETPVE